MEREQFQYYENSGYKNTRNKKRTLILDIEDNTALGAGSEFNIKLYEPLIVDKQSEVYLDNVSTFNSNIAQTPETGAFLLKINEFNMNSNVASTSHGGEIFNTLTIPNEHKTVSNNHTSVIQKGKKFNYVCDINPKTIHSLSGKITDLGGLPMFHGSDTTGKFTYALSGIDASNYSATNGFPVAAGTAFVLSETGSTVSFPQPGTTGTFLAYHFNNSTTLHFSTNNELTGFNRATTGTITFTIGGTPITVNQTASLNLNLTLINNPGRFTAEFSIISV